MIKIKIDKFTEKYIREKEKVVYDDNVANLGLFGAIFSILPAILVFSFVLVNSVLILDILNININNKMIIIYFLPFLFSLLYLFKYIISRFFRVDLQMRSVLNKNLISSYRSKVVKRSFDELPKYFLYTTITYIICIILSIIII